MNTLFHFEHRLWLVLAVDRSVDGEGWVGRSYVSTTQIYVPCGVDAERTAMQFELLEFDEEDATKAVKIRAHLAEKGTPIVPYDSLIAVQARARGLTLITHNTNEFSRVPD